VPERWRDALPRQERHGGIIDSFGLVKAIGICAALSALFLLMLWRGSDLVAHLVPERWEVALGESLVGDLGGKDCADPAGQRALDALARRLGPGDAPIKVRVIHLGMVNAVALPGRQILIFDGLLDEANSPDELAGVLGHEMGHVANRDVMAGLIRGFGLSLLIGGADGGAIMQSLITSRYSRATERAADGEALERLGRAGVSPLPTAAFFDRLGRMEKKLGGAERALGWIGSHPLSAERRERFNQAARAGASYRPAMSAAEWQALRGICRTADGRRD